MSEVVSAERELQGGWEIRLIFSDEDLRRMERDRMLDFEADVRERMEEIVDLPDPVLPSLRRRQAIREALGTLRGFLIVCLSLFLIALAFGTVAWAVSWGWRLAP